MCRKQRERLSELQRMALRGKEIRVRENQQVMVTIILTG